MGIYIRNVGTCGKPSVCKPSESELWWRWWLFCRRRRCRRRRRIYASESSQRIMESYRRVVSGYVLFSKRCVDDVCVFECWSLTLN